MKVVAAFLVPCQVAATTRRLRLVVEAKVVRVSGVANLPRMQQVADARPFDFLALPMILQQQQVAVAAATAPSVVQQVAQMDQREESMAAAAEPQLRVALVAFRETVFQDWLVRNTPVETVAMKAVAVVAAGGAAAAVATTAAAAADQVT